MNDSRHDGVGAGDQSEQLRSQDTMSSRMPEITRTLRGCGVARVVASYEHPLCLLAFLDSKDDAMSPPCSPSAIREVTDLFASLASRRLSGIPAARGGRGTFDWNLVRDSLTHEHTLTYKGL
jgi:hypothetical protein